MIERPSLEEEFRPLPFHRHMTGFELALKKAYDIFKDAGFDTAILDLGGSGWAVTKGTPTQTAALLHFEYKEHSRMYPQVVLDLKVPFAEQLAGTAGLQRADLFTAPTIKEAINGFDKDGFDKMNGPEKRKALPEYMSAEWIGDKDAPIAHKTTVLTPNTP